MVVNQMSELKQNELKVVHSCYPCTQTKLGNTVYIVINAKWNSVNTCKQKNIKNLLQIAQHRNSYQH